MSYNRDTTLDLRTSGSVNEMLFKYFAKIHYSNSEDIQNVAQCLLKNFDSSSLISVEDFKNRIHKIEGLEALSEEN